MSFVLGSTEHGAMIFSRLDVAQTFKGETYGVGAQIMHLGAYQADEVVHLKKLLDLRQQNFGDDVVMLDIGANVGVHAVECGRFMNGWGKVIAFEPQERLFYALCGNIALNNLLNVKATHAAVGEDFGVITVPGVDYTEYGSYGSLELMGENGDLGQDLVGKLGNVIKLVTVDFYELPRVDVIKIDAEGMELEVIRGAVSTIVRCQPVLWIDNFKVTPDKLVTELTALAYETYQVGPNTLAYPAGAHYVKQVSESEFEHLQTVEEAVHLGNCGAAEEAIPILEDHLKRLPRDHQARFNLGTLYMQVNHFNQATSCYATIIRAWEIDHDEGAGLVYERARFGRGFANLMQGHLPEGFIDFEMRAKTPMPDGLKAVPELWRDGAGHLNVDVFGPNCSWDDLRGQTVFVMGEMGFGDNIMFSRYLKMLVEKGLNVCLAVPPQLRTLMACLPYIQVHGERSPKPDMWIRMMSLARLFETSLDTVPAPTEFDLEGRQGFIKWKGAMVRHTTHAPFKVGLCWSGSRKSTYDENRSIPLEKLRPLFEIPGIDFHSLQLDIRESDKEAYDISPIFGTAAGFKDFMDTACAISCMDLVITVDTSICHLAGSLGVPTWVMLTSFRTYWMWIINREDSPWYPGMKAYRQVKDGDWDEVIDRLVVDLRAFVTAPPPAVL